jgi:hypothetical protein
VNGSPVKGAAREAAKAAAGAATEIGAAVGTAALDAATTGGKPGQAAKEAAVTAGLQTGFRLLSVVLAKVGRWRAGLQWQPGQTRALDLDTLSEPQRLSLLSDPGFEVKPAEPEDSNS